MTSASTYNVLVIGAGPAGSAAAWALARAGLRVALVDQQSIPRDKVCGDALIPDALGAIDDMGLRAAITVRRSGAGWQARGSTTSRGGQTPAGSSAPSSNR